MRLRKLLERLEYRVVRGSTYIEVAEPVRDSREVGAGSVFVCIRGTCEDGRRFIPDALRRGAAAIVTEQEAEATENMAEPEERAPEVEIPAGVTVIRVRDARYALALMSAAYYGYPAEKLRVIGVTGTKGKTTTAYMIREILECAGHRCGLIGTVEAVTGAGRYLTDNTTPESCLIQRWLAEMVKAGCGSAVVEVSSQGIKMKRTAGIPFEIGVFTNLGRDHIGPGEHGSFEEYMNCKRLLFSQCRTGIGNADDPYFADIFRGASCEVETVGFSQRAELRAENPVRILRSGCPGTVFHIAGKMEMDVETGIPGRFNVCNALLAAAVSRHFGARPEQIRQALKRVRVKGRMEPVEVPGGVTVLIDYAHNAMSLKSLLLTLREYHPKRLVCLFGCDGNRSRDRRFGMGEVSGRLADLTVITSDNPRWEPPLSIMADIREGIRRTSGKYVEICDRREAIRYVLASRRPGDVIVLAGKGHEGYQEIRGKKYPMDERQIIGEILEDIKPLPSAGHPRTAEMFPDRTAPGKPERRGLIRTDTSPRHREPEGSGSGYTWLRTLS